MSERCVNDVQTRREHAYGILNDSIVKDRAAHSRLVRLADENSPGGADRDRTDDLRLAKPALSQLSYSPLMRAISTWWA